MYTYFIFLKSYGSYKINDIIKWCILSNNTYLLRLVNDLVIKEMPITEYLDHITKI